MIRFLPRLLGVGMTLFRGENCCDFGLKPEIAATLSSIPVIPSGARNLRMNKQQLVLYKNIYFYPLHKNHVYGKQPIRQKE